MQIYILRDNQQTGPFTEADVRTQLAAGTITPATMVWWDGLPEWKALADTPLASAPTVPPVVGGVPIVPPPVTSFSGEQKTSGLAIGALICGIVGIFCAPVLGLAAVIMGHIARAQVKKDPTQKGSGLALAGLILGYFWILCFIAYIGFIATMGPKIKEQVEQMQKQLQEEADKAKQDADKDNPPPTPPAPEQPATPPPATPDNTPANPPPATPPANPGDKPAPTPATPPSNQ